jgi:hypothetical protein
MAETGPPLLEIASLAGLNQLVERVASERRHPDIGSGRPWPPEAVAYIG